MTLLGLEVSGEHFEQNVVIFGVTMSWQEAESLVAHHEWGNKKGHFVWHWWWQVTKASTFSSYFFKKVWKIVGSHFMEAVMEFFTTNSLLKQTNHTEIVSAKNEPCSEIRL